LRAALRDLRQRQQVRVPERAGRKAGDEAAHLVGGIDEGEPADGGRTRLGVARHRLDVAGLHHDAPSSRTVPAVSTSSASTIRATLSRFCAAHTVASPSTLETAGVIASTAPAPPTANAGNTKWALPVGAPKISA
jgi:hypothetical protein